MEAAWPRLVRALSGLSGDRAGAEDALQDAVEAALKPGVLKTIERADAWLYAVAARHIRRNALQRAAASGLDLLRSRSTPAPGIDRLAALELLRGLSERQREFVIARYYLDLTYRDIATHFGVSVGTATATVTQSLKRVRQRINADPEELNAWKTE